MKKITQTQTYGDHLVTCGSDQIKQKQRDNWNKKNPGFLASES